MRALAFTLPLTVSLLATPFAQEGVRLAWKFTEGDVMRYRTTTTMDQTFTSPVEATNAISTAQVLSQKVESVGEDGTGTLKCTWEALRIRVESSIGQTVEYDSTDSASTPPEPLEAVSKLVGLGFGMRMRPSGEVGAFQGLKEVVETLLPAGDAASAGLKEMLGGLLEEENLRRTVEAAVWPDRGLKEGDTWTRDLDVPLGPLGKLKARYEYTFQGEAEELGTKCAKVAVEYRMTSSGTQPDLSGIPGAEMLDIDLEIGDSKGTGTLFFSLEGGRLVRSEIETSIEITMKMTPKAAPEDAAMDPIEVGMEMDMRVEMRLLGADEPAFEKARSEAGTSGGR